MPMAIVKQLEYTIEKFDSLLHSIVRRLMHTDVTISMYPSKRNRREPPKKMLFLNLVKLERRTI